MTEKKPDDPKRVDARPTKALFIHMLTRDIQLIPAIIDLVDNSGDGARRLRPDGDYSDLRVTLTFDGGKFEIQDRCGGIAPDVAREYAFRFGRQPDFPALKHSVGQFGVGMKRALFKLGRSFRIESSHKKGRFTLEVDVVKWERNENDWDFRFDEVEDKPQPKSNWGTKITVNALSDDVAAKFALESFEDDLVREIASRLRVPIERGLAVLVNGQSVQHPVLEFVSGDFAPSYEKRRYDDLDADDGQRKPPVTLRIWCGLARDKGPDRAGWYVYCNGRLVLEAEKTDKTGWGYDVEDLAAPAFHQQYNYFRGVAMFDCDDPGRLPWNTMKTDVVPESPIYRDARQQMVRHMRPVISCLNRLKEERAAEKDVGKGGLTKKLEDAVTATLGAVHRRREFSTPTVKPKTKRGPPLQIISTYEKPKDQAEAVRAKLRATSWRDVGSRTFDYYHKRECEGD